MRFGWALAALSAACGTGGRDLIPPSRDAVGASRGDESIYMYVARMRHGVVALADARGIAEGDATAGTRRLASAFDACAGRLAAEGRLVPGAARVVARVAASGLVDSVSISRRSPGDAVLANLLVCIVSPLKLVPFPPAGPPSPAPRGDGGADEDRGIALEAEWGGT